jgi:hypothetical protein
VLCALCYHNHCVLHLHHISLPTQNSPNASVITREGLCLKWKNGIQAYDVAIKTYQSSLKAVIDKLVTLELSSDTVNCLELAGGRIKLTGALADTISKLSASFTGSVDKQPLSDGAVLYAKSEVKRFLNNVHRNGGLRVSSDVSSHRILPEDLKLTKNTLDHLVYHVKQQSTNSTKNNTPESDNTDTRSITSTDLEELLQELQELRKLKQAQAIVNTEENQVPAGLVISADTVIVSTVLTGSSPQNTVPQGNLELQMQREADAKTIAALQYELYILKTSAAQVSSTSEEVREEVRGGGCWLLAVGCWLLAPYTFHKLHTLHTLHTSSTLSH